MRTGGKYATAGARWAGMGPYFAMFPSAFADAVVAEYSNPGDTVLDPFAGRGTALFSAATAGRNAIGIEINPVGWVYCRTKLSPAPREAVLERIAEVESRAPGFSRYSKKLPPFFHRCFSNTVLPFLVCARSELDWRGSDVDRTAMAFLLIHLHGKSTDSLSNQLRQAKAMSPRYAVKWWQEHGLRPPAVAPLAFFERKLKWRYRKGTPETSKSVVLFGDSTSLMGELEQARRAAQLRSPSLLLTSPPYFGITDYHYDQWIRLWLLGGPPTDRKTETEFRGKHQGKFSDFGAYKDLLYAVFESCAKMLNRDGVVYVRSDRREPTASVVKTVLKDTFPSHRLRSANRPLTGQTQTRLFGYHAPRSGEVDFILSPLTCG
jgi:hypothetical protein